MAYAQAIEALKCLGKPATTYLLSDTFFNKQSRAYNSTIDRLLQLQREFRGQYAPIQFNPTDNMRPSTFPTLFAAQQTEPNPYFQATYPPTSVQGMEQLYLTTLQNIA